MHTTAASLRAALEAAATEADYAKTRSRIPDEAVPVIGVRMGTIFDLAKKSVGMPLDEVDALFSDPAYEPRMAAVSILDAKARSSKLSDDERAALYQMFMRRIDRINTWDLIDRGAPRVVGRYLLERPRTVLFVLASSPEMWHRRMAITAAFWLIRSGDLDDPMRLCEALAADPEHFVQTNVGVALREIGRVDPDRLREFLERRGGELSAHARRTARSALQ